jgi:hypothetical protein
MSRGVVFEGKASVDPARESDDRSDGGALRPRRGAGAGPRGGEGGRSLADAMERLGPARGNETDRGAALSSRAGSASLEGLCRSAPRSDPLCARFEAQTGPSWALSVRIRLSLRAPQAPLEALEGALPTRIRRLSSLFRRWVFKASGLTLARFPQPGASLLLECIPTGKVTIGKRQRLCVGRVSDYAWSKALPGEGASAIMRGKGELPAEFSSGGAPRLRPAAAWGREGWRV